MDTIKGKIIERFWLEKLDGELAKISLPLVIKGPKIRGTLSLEIPGKIHNNLEEISKGSDMVLYLLFLSGLNVVLHKYTGIEDLLIGTLPPKGKGLREEIVFFRNRIAGDLTFKEYVNQVKEVVLDAFNHVQEEYSFNDIYNKLCARRGAASLDIFNIGFIYDKFQDKDKLRRFQSFDLLFTLSGQDKRMGLEVEYDTGLYPEEMVGQFSRHVVDLFADISGIGDVAIFHIDILGYEERKRLLVEFNDTKKDYPADKALHELFEEQVEQRPDGIAIVYEESHITYEQLNESANRLAIVLRNKGVGPDRIVVMVIDRSLEMIIGILGVLKAGGAYLPIEPGLPPERVKYMFEDSQAQLLVTRKKYSMRYTFANTVIDIDIENDDLYRGKAENLENLTQPDNLGYVIYTSGTTGKPKGTLTTHRNVIRVVRNTNYIDIKGSDRILQLSNYAFDGSTFDIYGALLNGAVLVMMKKEDVLSVDILSEVIKSEKISVFFVTTALFNALVDLNIGCFDTIRSVLFGGERVSLNHSRRALAHLGAGRVVHVYGPTETTVYASYYPLDSINESLGTIPIGKPLANTTLYILDRNMNPVPIGVSGEVYIGGDGLARGYLNHPELTAEKFLSISDKSYRFYRTDISKKIYKTGDLARWLPGGNVEFLDRIDQQVKIRGFRIELEEIEHQLLRHDRIKEAVVLARDNEAGDKYLCAYIVATDPVAGSGLKDYLKHSLPDYMIPFYFVPLARMPLTPNGKVDRKALPVPGGLAVEKKYEAPGNEIEMKLVGIWAEVLDVEPGLVGIDFDFFDMGGHSLKAAILTAKIHRMLHVNVPLIQIFQAPTIRELARYIRDAVKEKYAVIEPVEKKEYYTVSSAQRRIYILQEMDKKNVAYNIPVVYALQGILELLRLEGVFKKLITRHESFRTTFAIVKDEPHQQVHDPVEFGVEYYGIATGGTVDKIIRDFIRPFDLSQAPLLRVGVIKTGEEGHILMVDMHHIISDGTSMGVIIEDFMWLYKGKPLPVLRIQYKDYSEWQSSSGIRNAIMGQQNFWLKEFTADERLPVLNLPLDYRRPAVQVFEGSILDFEISEEETRDLKALMVEEGVTLFMMLLSIYYVFLAKLSGQEDIVVGSPIAGRRHADLQNIVGMFVNTLPLRNLIRGEQSFQALLKQVKQKALHAFENQDYLFEDLAEQAAADRDVSRNPLFDVVFTLQNLGMLEMKIPGLSLRHYRYESVISKFDLTLFAFESEEKILFNIEYCTQLFTGGTIERFIRYFKEVLTGVLEAPGKRIAEIEIIPADEKRQILEVFNNTRTQYPGDKTVHQLFAEQVKRTSDSVAVVGSWRKMSALGKGERRGETVQLTYGELNRKSDQLAYLLRERGVEADGIVAVMLERSVEMAVGVLGILKAGGAYLPVDPDYPEERQRYMLADSNAKVLLAAPAARVKVEIKVKEKEEPIEIIDISSDFSSSISTLSKVGSFNLVYILYTSGSTGRSKAVMVDHHSVVRLVRNTDFLDFQEEHRLLQTGALDFDASTMEIWGPLLNGCQLFLVDKDTILSPQRLRETIETHHITTMWMTSPLFNQMVTADVEIFAGLRYLLVGGDVLNPVHINRVREEFPHLHVINGYGPTENTTFSTTFLIGKEYRENIPIGSPISNSTAFIVDRRMHLLAIGIPGELLVGGEGVSRGYLNRPELTVEKFVDIHPSSFLTHRLYRTGDLARWLSDGNIEFIGRIDQQVKIRGFRIEPGEVEAQLIAISSIKEAVVIDRETKAGEKYLCGYIISEEKIDPREIKEILSQRLPGYMIPSFFVRLEKIPLTPNGKVERRSLPGPEVEIGDRYTAPRDEIEETLAEMWAEILGLDKSLIGIDDNFFELGGHSLKATILMTRIHREYDTRIELTEIFVNPFIRSLAKHIRESKKEKYVPLVPVEEKEYYPLSYAQRRLWILCQFEEDSSAYNIPNAVVMSGNLDIEVYRRSLQVVVDRHESLRTVFVVINGKPVQKIIEHLKYEAEEIDLRHPDAGIKEQEARELYSAAANNVFDLEHGPLILVRFIRLEDERYLFVNNIHHIVCDGWSCGIFYNEIFTLYNAFLNNNENPFSPLAFRYIDYSYWYNALIEGERFKKAEKYWLDKFMDKPNGIDLPLDHPRHAVQTFNGGRISFIIDEERKKQLIRLGPENEVTFFMTFLTVFMISLCKYSGQRDIIIGSPIAGRKLSELDNMIGFLVNTIVFRKRIDPDENFSQLVKKIRAETLECYEHQDYPFDLLVEKLNLERDLSQSPLFNVMLAHNNTDTISPDTGMEGMSLSSYTHADDFNMSKFDLIFFMDDRASEVEIKIEYNSDLFERRTIERMSRSFLALVDDLIDSPEVPIYALNYIDEAEYEKVVDIFNDNAVQFSDLNLQELFERQVEQSGDKTAVVCHAQAVTYGELNKQANQLANYLREEYHIKPNDIIGVAVDRSIKMIIALLGIIKSGAGYVAIDPNYPEERLQHMLDDSRARLLIFDKMRPELFGDYKGEMINIYTDWEEIGKKSDRNPRVTNQPLDVLYVIYTSGSTGTPNGAMLSHGILTNLVQWQQEKTSIDASLRCLQFTSINFCVSFQEIIITLTAGGEVHLIGDIERQDIEYLMDFLVAHRINVLYLPFSYLNFLFNESGRWGQSFKHHLKHIITAGEQLKISAGLKKFLEANPRLKLHNHYGSSEMHVVTSYTLDASSADRVPIPPAGKPIANTGIYILDDYENPVPIGIWGELFVSGSSEVLGYIHNPRLTDKKLLNHPSLSADGKRLYRSGDLGRWLEDGNIELKGRKDEQVKVRGFRVEPGEIESKILAVDTVKECVVVVKTDERENKYLAAYVVFDRANVNLLKIKKSLSKDLPQHMMPELISLDALPLMPNGKVDRDRLPEPVLAGKVVYAGPRSRMEEKLVEIWSEVLGVDKELIGIDDNFFELGGHSLKATTVVSEIHRRLNVKIPLTEMFKAPVIRDLSACIKEAARDKYTSIEFAEKKKYYSLSPAQQRMYIVQQLNLASITYNLPQVLYLEGKLDVEKLEHTFRMLVKRHESFRTSFITVNGEPVQEVCDSVEFGIEYYDLNTDGPEEKIIGNFIRPFVLPQAPLLRVGSVKIEEEKHILMVDMHHIIADGVSYAIFVEELMALYEGKQPPLLGIQYKDFSEWQKSKIEKGRESLKKAENYWLKEFAGEIPVLELPNDHPRPEIFSFEGSRVVFEVGKEETEALRRFIKEEDVTLFMVLLAVYYVLLSRTSGQEDIVVGVPMAGRNHVDLQSIIGMFVSTLALRNYPRGNKTFREFLLELKKRALNAFDNEDYQFEDLVDKLGIKRKTNRGALFDVMFGLQNLGDRSQNLLEIKIPGLKLTPYDTDIMVSRNDLCLYAFEKNDGIDCFFEYSTKLFKPATIEILKDRYIILLKRILANPGCRIGDLDYRTEVEKELDKVEDVGFDF